MEDNNNKWPANTEHLARFKSGTGSMHFINVTRIESFMFIPTPSNTTLSVTMFSGNHFEHRNLSLKDFMDECARAMTQVQKKGRILRPTT